MMEIMVELIQDLHQCFIIVKQVLFRPICESIKSFVIFSKIFSDREILVLHINILDLYVACSM
jgi:hypothetical protein